MANTISVMTNAVRGVVSKKRIRYQENGYDLDLAYVTDRLIAMGFPADKIEGFYRNKLEDVKHFLEEKHKDHYKIYNLCSERHYHPDKFDGRVAEYPFVDHNPPPMKLIKEFCDDVDVWLKADKENVAAVHCKAGKGRTGTMICCYLLHCQIKKTAEDALAYYDDKRTKNKKGVTIPSQRRYVEYYAKLVNSGQPYEERPLQICEIRFSPQFPNQDNIYCSIYPYPTSENPESTTISLKVIDIKDKFLEGDVKIEVYRKAITMRKERYFHFWVNTFFICDNAAAYDDGGEKKFVVELAKHELDDIHKDTEHKTVPQDFKVQLVFKPVPRDHHSITSSVASHIRNNHKSPSMLRHHENHHATTCYYQVSSNNIGNHHNNTANLQHTTTPLSPVNHTSEPPTTTMTNTSAPRLSSMGSSSSGSSIGENQQQQHQHQPPPPTLTSNSMANHQLTNRRNHSNNTTTTNHVHGSGGGDCNSIDTAAQAAATFCLGSNGRNSTTSAITTTDAHTPSVSSSRSGSINSSDPSSHSAGFGDDVGDEEDGWESEFCRMNTTADTHKFTAAYPLGRKYSDNICMMSSSSSIRRRATIPSSMPLSVPSSTASLLTHMIQNGAEDGDDDDDSAVIHDENKDNVKNNDGGNGNDHASLAPSSSSSSSSRGSCASVGHDDDDILRTLISSTSSSAILTSSNRLQNNRKSKPILIEPSTSSNRRQSNVSLSFGLRSILTRSFCRRPRREST